MKWMACPTLKNTVVSDELPDDAVRGSEDVDAYGGYFMVAESVAPSVIPLIVAAPKMRDVLRRAIPALMECRAHGTYEALLLEMSVALQDADGRK